MDYEMIQSLEEITAADLRAGDWVTERGRSGVAEVESDPTTNDDGTLNIQLWSRTTAKSLIRHDNTVPDAIYWRYRYVPRVEIHLNANANTLPAWLNEQTFGKVLTLTAEPDYLPSTIRFVAVRPGTNVPITVHIPYAAISAITAPRWPNNDDEPTVTLSRLAR